MDVRNALDDKYGAREMWMDGIPVYKREAGIDHVALVYPPGTNGSWKGYAATNGMASFYNDAKILNLQTIAHEFGHNFGLEHSGYDCDGCQDNLKSYFDGTGYMGLYSSSTADDDIRKCFNAMKSYKLRWYEDQVKSINPTGKWLLGKPPKSYQLIGPVSYTAGDSNGRFVSLELTDWNPDKFTSKWYVGYNRARDHTESCDSSVLPCIGTEDRDKVSIFEHNSTDWSTSGGATSWKRHVFDGPGDTYTISNFAGQTDKTVTVTLVSYSDDSEVATIKVTFPETDEDDTPVLPTCKNKKGKTKYEKNGKQKKGNCNQIKKRGDCWKKNKWGKYLWDAFCPLKCKGKYKPEKLTTCQM